MLSIIILDPLFIALCVLHDSIKLVSSSSMSDFTVTSTNSNPSSRSHVVSLRHLNSPVDLLGTMVLSKALVEGSLVIKNANVFPSLSSSMNMWSKWISGTCLSSSVALRQSSHPPFPLMQCLHQPERKMRHLVFPRSLPFLSKLFLFLLLPLLL